MRNSFEKDYGEEIWEAKIKSQNESGVIFGSSFSLKDVEEETKEFMRKIDKEVIPLLKNGSKLLDLGVGPMARFSIEFVKRGFLVTGTDISETTLKIAEKYAKRAGVKIDFIKEDITEIDKINKKFDVVFCRATFYHVPPHLTGISLVKVNRILKKNGIAIIEFGIKNKETLFIKIKNFIYFTGHYIKRFFGKGFKVNVSRFTRGEINEMLDKSGFKIEKMVDSTTYVLKLKNS